MEHELLSVLTDIFCTVKNLNKNLVEIVDHSKQVSLSLFYILIKGMCIRFMCTK